MIKRTLREIQEMAGGFGLPEAYLDYMIEGVSIDSRSIKENQLFVPIIGERFNGHEFLEKAVAQGAKAALWSRYEAIPPINIPLILVEDTQKALQELAMAYRKQLNVKVIGITGSNGKTSTKDILAAILGIKYKTYKTLGNLNNHLGVPLSLLAMDQDTEMAVIEMGMSSLGEIRLLTNIANPDGAIITNIGEAHLEDLKTKENILKAKLEIIEGLKPGGFFLYNSGDPLLKTISEEQVNPFQIVTFGEGGMYVPVLDTVEEEGIRFHLKGLTDSMYLPMLGKHQMENAAAAMAMGYCMGLSWKDIEAGLKKINVTAARNELIHGQGLTILNDSYKSNPLSLKAALETLYGLKKYSQKIAVLSDMNGLGEDAISLHRQAADYLDPDQLDYLLTMGPLSKELANAAMKKFPRERVIHCVDLNSLALHINRIIKEGAIILIKGSREQQLELLVEELRQKNLLEVEHTADTAPLHRDTWVEIRLDIIANNIRQIKYYLPPATKLMAAVKADAYGHGDLQVAEIALEAGADALAVSILKEALHLRGSGIKAPILVLTPILPSDVDLAIQNDLSVTVFQGSWLEEMRAYKKDPRPLKIHLKIDTGLGRLGLRNKEELEEILPLLRQDDILLEGMYTHFATANWEDETFFNQQFAAFTEIMDWVKSKGLKVENYHCSNTAATLKHPECSLDMVRIGVGMFGIYPSAEIKRTAPLSLQSALSFHSKVLHVKRVDKGSTVGYDTAYVAEGDEWIATIPVGYADGWFRCFQGFYVLIGGEKAPIVGKICMDQLMVRLPKWVPIGTQVTLIGRQQEAEITLEQLADHIGSVPQEIPSMITYRVPRIYYNLNQRVQILTERIWQDERRLI